VALGVWLKRDGCGRSLFATHDGSSSTSNGSSGSSTSLLSLENSSSSSSSTNSRLDSRITSSRVVLTANTSSSSSSSSSPSDHRRASSALSDQLVAQCMRSLAQHAASMSAGELAVALWGLANAGAPHPKRTAMAPIWEVGEPRLMPAPLLDRD